MLNKEAPCKDCITLAICRSDCSRHRIGFFFHVIPKCVLIRDYLQVASWTRVTITMNKEAEGSIKRLNTVGILLGVNGLRIYEEDVLKNSEITKPVKVKDVPFVTMHTGKPLITDKERREMIKSGKIKTTSTL